MNKKGWLKAECVQSVKNTSLNKMGPSTFGGCDFKMCNVEGRCSSLYINAKYC